MPPKAKPKAKARASPAPKPKPTPKAAAKPKPVQAAGPPAKVARGNSGSRLPRVATLAKPKPKPAPEPKPAPKVAARPTRSASAKPAPAPTPKPKPAAKGAAKPKPKPKPSPKRGVKRKSEELEDTDADAVASTADTVPSAAPTGDDSAVAEATEVAVAASSAAAPPRKRPPVDAAVPTQSQYEVVFSENEYWDATLNQTNIGSNNNKYYIVQLLRTGEEIILWTHWGRVGEDGQSELARQGDLEMGKMAFKKKFQDKTGNKWEARAAFVKKAGKYDLVDVAVPDEEEQPQAVVVGDKKIRPSDLPAETQKFLALIFDQDMFKDSMKALNIDTQKMPLGKLSKAQVEKGFHALEELEAAIKDNAAPSRLEELTSRFYTIIPHDFGRSVPIVLKTESAVREKFDLLNTLHDIAMAQQLQKEGTQESKALEEIDHPLDSHYKALQCTLSAVPKDSSEWSTLTKYFNATGPGGATVVEIFRMDRSGEKDRFARHSDLGNRRLLWHGTNVAVVAAILRTGLRIMPHSGGRVGAGIYFASESSKSYGYVRPAVTPGGGRVGIMFLNEVALGKEHTITVDDWSIKAPPDGYDCVVARGITEPDPSLDTTISGEFGDIVVPQGAPISSAYSTSRFTQSEYLVYQESRVRMKYVLLVNMR